MAYAMSGSYLSSPDQPSSVYPDRLIRPLPKRTLRSRLSEEAAEAIPFPPNLPSTSLPTYNTYGENGEYSNEDKVHVQGNGDVYEHEDHHDHDHYHDHDHCIHHHHHCDHDHDDDEEDDEDDIDSGEDGIPVATRRAYGHQTRSALSRSPRDSRGGQRTAKSSSSGPDGYDAFENTNNKKKRKIPTSGSLSLHHSSLTADLAHMGLSGSKDGGSEDGSGVGQYYGSGSAAVPAGLGVQGAGRGRFGRRSSGRNPLGVSVNGSNAKVAPRVDRLAPTTLGSKDEQTKQDQGIISAAIANATALLRKPVTKGQENVGVLDQQTKQTPSNSQFTFTCETEAKGVTFPEQSLYAAGYPQRTSMPAPATGGNQKFATHGTQTSPNMTTQNNQQAPPVHPGSQPATAQGKKPRRRRGDVYGLAARQRRLQQEYSNLHHPPAPEDVWICEFCEYESIFGVAPQALIRQYEIKDRKERRRLAEKRRLLEKAKLKGRKGKKQTKNAAKNNSSTSNTAGHQPVNQAGYDQQPLDHLGDDYLDDGYDEDPVPMPAPPPAPAVAKTKTARRNAPKATMPGDFDREVGG